jgi:hypothetical protein
MALLFVIGLVLISLNAAHIIFIAWAVALIPWLIIVIYGVILLIINGGLEELFFFSFIFLLFD